MKKNNGEITGSRNTINKKNIRMNLKKTIQRNVAKSELIFSEGGKKLLVITTQKSMCKDHSCLGITQISAKGQGTNYQMLIDFKSGKNKQSNFANVIIKNKGMTQKGRLNLNTKKIIGCKNYALINALSKEQINMINSFRVPLKSIAKFHELKIKSSILSTYSVLGTSEGLILLSFKGSLCRAACWAVAAAATAACCGGTAGALCIACAAIWAADASLCSDLCPP